MSDKSITFLLLWGVPFIWCMVWGVLAALHSRSSYCKSIWRTQGNAHIFLWSSIIPFWNACMFIISIFVVVFYILKATIVKIVEGKRWLTTFCEMFEK